MPLSNAQITQVFEIFGVPENGSGDVTSQVASVFGPVSNAFDFTAIAAKLNARLAALSDTQATRSGVLLARWDALTSFSPLRITQSAKAGGVFADPPAERAAIRSALSNVIGFATPSGGFAAEAARFNDVLSVTR